MGKGRLVGTEIFENKVLVHALEAMPNRRFALTDAKVHVPSQRVQRYLA